MISPALTELRPLRINYGPPLPIYQAWHVKFHQRAVPVGDRVPLLATCVTLCESVKIP